MKIKKEDLPIKEQVCCDVDDMVYEMMKRIEEKYNLSWENARDYTNSSIRKLYEFCDSFTPGKLHDVDDAKKIIMIIKELEQKHGKLVPVNEILKQENVSGSDIETLKKSGHIYSPKRGFVVRME